MKKPDVLCLGTVKLGIPDYGFSSNNTTSQFDPVAFLKQAELMGISHFDTSPRYGQSEEILGKYIVQRITTPFVSSKIDNLSPGDCDTPGKMLASVQTSLLKLHLTKLDICYLHQNELNIISDAYVHEGLMLLKEQNLIRFTGASLYSLEECEYVLESGLFDVIQIPVSVFDISLYNRFVRGKCNSVRFVARSLLLQGILINRNVINFRIRQSHQVLAYLKQIDQLAEECGLSTLELALAFVFSLRNIDHYLIGTTSIENLNKDIKCLNIKLPTQAFMRILDMASQPASWTNPRNWN
ncbi:MAG: aldo/keto reductase [Candidatus Aminicenantes bacterium]|nr:aldo/keto reductase [Candidatus Aminicenantes bacterium]